MTTDEEMLDEIREYNRKKKLVEEQQQRTTTDKDVDESVEAKADLIRKYGE